jgi:hypothetical protein
MTLRGMTLIATLLLMARAVPGAEPIELNQTLTGTLEQGDETTAENQLQDTYTFNAAQGQNLTIHLHSDAFDGVLSATDANGRAVENDDSGSTRDSEVALSDVPAGPVEIRVRAFLAGAAGDYVLALAPTEVASSGLRGAAQTSTLPISVGQIVRGRLEPGDQRLNSGEWTDFYHLYGEAGTPLTFDLQSTEFDPYLIIVRPSGQHDENDDAAPGDATRSQVSLALPETGDYLVGATTYKPGMTGAYELTISPGLAAATPPPPQVTAPAANTIAPGQSVSGRLEQGDQTLRSGEFMDAYTMQGQAGQPVTFSLSSSAFDTYLIVVLPDGTQQENDDAGSQQYSEVSLQLPQTGEYRVIATSYAPGESGDYQLAVSPGLSSRPAPTPAAATQSVAPIASGQQVNGELATGDGQLNSGEFVDRYSFEGQAGQTVSVALDATAFDPYLILWFPSSGQQDNDDVTPGQNHNSLIQMTLPEAGTYVIGCTSYSPGEHGPYSVSLNLGGAAAPAPPQPTPTPPAVQPLPTAAGGGPKYYGIFCGISDYAPYGPGAGGPDLPLCNSDAVKLATTLEQMGLIASGDAIVLTDAEATRANILSAFQTLSPRVGPNDVFIFFYSGHGGKNRPYPTNPEADQCDEYIVCSDEEPIIDDEMARLFDAVNADIAICCLDSCFSGGFAKDVIVKPHRLGLFSSEEDLTSAVADKFQAGGYLSHYFLTGMRGEADDDPRNSVLTVGELCHYLQVQFARNVVENVESSGMRNERGYQQLVVDRGGCKLDDVLVALAH